MSAVLLRKGASLESLLNSFTLAPWALAVFQDVVQNQCTLNGGKTH